MKQFEGAWSDPTCNTFDINGAKRYFSSRSSYTAPTCNKITVRVKIWLRLTEVFISYRYIPTPGVLKPSLNPKTSALAFPIRGYQSSTGHELIMFLFNFAEEKEKKNKTFTSIWSGSRSMLQLRTNGSVWTLIESNASNHFGSKGKRRVVIKGYGSLYL